MNLLIDAGNTLTKVAVSDGKKLIFNKSTNSPDKSFFEDVFSQFQITGGILSSVINFPEESIQFLELKINLLIFSPEIKIPIENNYNTPLTLGRDRLAAAVGANFLFPESDVVVLDAGTCLKHEFISQNTYQGGSISPGLQMRLQSLNDYTQRLPLVELSDLENPPGNSTNSSILQGCYGGMLGEMEYWINHYKAIYPDLKVILTGGDASYFVEKLKKPIFVLPNLIFTGLEVILNYNA